MDIMNNVRKLKSAEQRRWEFKDIMIMANRVARGTSSNT